MLITTLGTGAAFTTGPHDYSGLLIDRHLLVDVVPQAESALRKLGVSTQELTGILVTHFHADHILGMPLLLPALPEDGEIPLLGPRGVTEKMISLCALFDREKHLSRLRFIEVPRSMHSIQEAGGYRIESFPMEHSDESLGYRITDTAGFTLAVSGDTAWHDGMTGLLTGADAAVMEMTFLDGGPGKHLSMHKHLIRALELLPDHAPLFLNHFGSPTEEYRSRLNELRAEADASSKKNLDRVILAEELATYRIERE